MAADPEAVVKAKPIWSFRTHNVLAGAFLSIEGGRIVFKLRPDLDGDRKEVISCLDLDGKRVWERRFDFDTVFAFFPSAGRLYLDGSLARCLSVDAGETLAERDVGAPVSSYGVIGSGPVYFVEPLGQLICLDPKTLKDVWQWKDPTGLSQVHDDVICRYELDGTIELVTLPSLKVLRKVQGPARSEYGTTHGHVGDLWCQMYDKERVGIDTRTGKMAWKKEEKEPGYHHLAEFVGAAAYSGDRDLSAFDMSNGELLWRQAFGEKISWLSCLPHIAADRIYGGTKAGLVYVVDRHSGKLESSIHVDFEPTAVRPLSADRVIVASHGQILCFPIP